METVKEENEKKKEYLKQYGKALRQEKVKPIEFDPDPQWAVQAELEECKNEKEEE